MEPSTQGSTKTVHQAITEPIAESSKPSPKPNTNAKKRKVSNRNCVVFTPQRILHNNNLP
ncbi:hypothetical protein Hdeb2414_s0013g00419921 [Helianthus debilis subsp. tardiflorus]